MLLVVVFMGLQEWEDAITKKQYLYIELYGFGNLKLSTASPLLNFPQYKYQLIIITFLIGLALFFSVKEK